MTVEIKIKIIITGFIISMLPVLVPAQNSQVQRQTIVEYTNEGFEETIRYADEIKEKELPEVVINSVKSSYPGHKLERAYRGSDGSYKLLLSMKDRRIAAFYDAGGEFIKLEGVKEVLENTNDHWR